MLPNGTPAYLRKQKTKTMSTFKEQLRDYNFTDARLVEIGLEKIAFAERDETELETMGVTPAWVLALKNSILAFGAMPSDEVELGEQQEATDDKDEDADNLRDKLKELRSAALRAFGEKSAKYKQFALMGISDMSNAELLRTAMVAHGVAVTYAAPLAEKGYDAADNTALQGLITAYVAGLQNQSMEVGSRDTAQENRVLAGNEVYKQLEKELCEAAKSYWSTRSAAKYNDYLIYNTTSGTAETETINFEVNPMTTLSLLEIDYRGNRHFTVVNNTPVPYIIFISLDGITPTGTPKPVAGNATVSTVCADLAPAGNFIMVRNENPGVIGTGNFTYEV